jgi:hypothetical protein
VPPIFVALLILGGGTWAAVRFIPPLLRKFCPECGKRGLAFHGPGMSPPQAPEPRKYWHYECAICKQHFASPDRVVYIKREDWDRGVRTAAPRATLTK